MRKFCEKCPFSWPSAIRIYKVGSKSYCSIECPEFRKAQQQAAQYEQARAARFERSGYRYNSSMEQLSFNFGDGQ